MPRRHSPRPGRPGKVLFQRVLTGESPGPLTASRRAGKGRTGRPLLRIGARDDEGASGADEPRKGMFLRVRRGDPRGLSRWGAGPRFVILCLAAGGVLALAFGRTPPTQDGRKAAFERVAALVNGPLGQLAPLRTRIASPGGGDMVWLAPRREACLEATPHVEALGRLSFPPDDRGAPIAPAEALRQAAGRFLEGTAACRGDAAPASKALPACVMHCMRGWSALAASAEQLRKDAAWVGVHVEPLAAPAQ